MMMTDCVRSGFCCRVAPCGFGMWDAEKRQCAYLTPDPESQAQQHLCAKYEEILKDPLSHISPAFGAGCSSTLFNEDRDRVIRLLGNPGHGTAGVK